MLGFLLGAIAGGAAAYYWRENIRDYVSKRVPELRDRTADGLSSLAERAGSALDRARSRVDTAVRTGQEQLRATGKSGTSGASPRTGIDADSEPSREIRPPAAGEPR
jgi:hypothetical protein